MFSRRRGQSNPPPRVVPSSAASTAAAQAFLANRVSTGDLSAAAAAAALRSHTTSPVPVSQVQTKRMIQRQVSTSSSGSAGGLARRSGGLQRQNSGGSMTERTFRDPSPARRPVSRSVDDDAPPLPPIPKDLAKSSALSRPKKRVTSVEPPARIASPPPKILGGRVLSLDRGTPIKAGKSNRQSGVQQSTPSSFEEAESPTGKSSINFSRPMSPTNSPATPLRGSPPSLPTGKKPEAKLSMAGMAALSASAERSVPSAVQETMGSPVKKNRNVPKQEALNDGVASKASDSENKLDRQGIQSLSTPPATKTGSLIEQPSESSVTGSKKKKKTNANRTGTPQGEQSGRISQQSYASDSDTGSELSYSSDRPRSYHTRAGGLLTKQPSIVREEREAEEEEERGTVANGTPGSAQKPAVGNTDTVPIESDPRRVPLAPSPTSSLAPATANGSMKRASLSPARAAHFPVQPIETPDGFKHQPLGRSLSPAKSALKHSPSSRGNSPAGPVPGGVVLPGQAPSEASDTTSVVSDDGYRPLSRKKKSTRVSFDDDPVVLGLSATPPSSLESPVTNSPQSKESTRKGWFGLGRDKRKDYGNPPPEDDGIIKPTPTLPSFGSIRGRKMAEEESSLAHDRPQTQTGLDTVAPSTDFVVGSILAQDHAERLKGSPQVRSSNDPLPPEVTSVEGSGYHSDSEDGADNSARYTGKASTLREPGVNADIAPGGGVPRISIQPATPGLSESTKEWLGMTIDSPILTEPSTPQVISPGREPVDKFTDQTPSRIGIAEPELEAVTAYHVTTSPAIGEVARSLGQQITVHDEDDAASDTGDSIYSDAAEDLSDLEGDGFGSINAIVDSPTSTLFPNLEPKNPVPSATYVSSSNDSTPTKKIPAEVGDSDRDPGLSEVSVPEKAKTASSAEVTQVQSAAIAKPKKKKKRAAVQSTGQVAPLKPSSLSTQTPERSLVTTDPPMKKSMRAPPQARSEVSHLRSSMRTSPPQTLPRNWPNLGDSTVIPAAVKPKETLQQKQRPVSAIAISDLKQSKILGTHARSASDSVPDQSSTPVRMPATIQPVKRATGKKIQPPPVIRPSPRRTFSNGSDSSSSFKKSRPAASESGRYSMKRSMRAASVDERSDKAPPPPSSRFSVRSLSPTGMIGRKQFSQPPTGMRFTMRGSNDLGNTRRPQSPTNSFGFGRSSKSKPAATKSSSRFSTRFGDSSDDDDDPSTFRSRFVDSSDEDEPVVRSTSKLTPVRGIPRRIDEGDSTDLEDSSEEKLPGMKGRPTAPPVPKVEGATLASGSLRTNGANPGASALAKQRSGSNTRKDDEKEKKKRSFFGGLGRRKDDSKITKADVESAARRDTPLERSNLERQMNANAQSPKAPKLQRRNTPKRYASDSWPLPPSPVVVDNRPMTSDGVTADNRPALGARQITAQTAHTSATDGVAVGRSGKKKRFPMLRKAFGLHD